MCENPCTVPRSTPVHGERGAILLAVMLIMIVLLGLGMSGLFLTRSNVQMLTNTNLRNQALYVAEAGLERARDILNGPVAPDLTELMGGTGHVANPADEVPATVDSVNGLPIGRGAILVDGAGVPLWRVNYPTSVAHGEAVPGNPGGLAAQLMGMYSVYIRNDTAECRMGKYTVDGVAAGGNQMVVIRSEGTANDGRTTVVLEMTMGVGAGGGNGPGAGGIAAVLCNAGKNACDDNNSVQNNVVVSN
jgi:Tfp pilus assembly protein PilX